MVWLFTVLLLGTSVTPANAQAVSSAQDRIAPPRPDGHGRFLGAPRGARVGPRGAPAALRRLLPECAPLRRHCAEARGTFHVYAVTRRGVGASDRPSAGYDPKRRADDVLAVIDALGMRKPILVGNACGGDILHRLGGQHPDRLGGLVYLDAAEDPTLKLSDYDFPPADRVNVAAFRGKPTPVTFPPAEQRRIEQQPLDPAIRKAITEDHLVRPDYASIKVPVLALYRSTTLQQALKDFPPASDREREAVELAVAARRTVLAKWQGDLLAGVPGARIVEVPGANLFMFLSHEAEVMREIRAFAATLPR